MLRAWFAGHRSQFAWIAASVICLAGPQGILAADADDAGAAGQAAKGPDNSLCLACHGNEGFAMPGADGLMR